VGELPRRFSQFFGFSIRQIDPIDNTDHGGFDRHVLIANRRTGGLAVRAYDDFAGARPETIRHDHHILRRFAVQIVG